jgi:hypothetical protein
MICARRPGDTGCILAEESTARGGGDGFGVNLAIGGDQGNARFLLLSMCARLSRLALSRWC